jgi:putative ABC transport system permease protein
VTPSVILLSYGDLAIAALLLLLNAGLSLWLKLGLEKRLLVATARMIVQFTLMGLVLVWLFTNVSLWFTGLAALVMVLFAGREAIARQDRRFSGLWGYGIGTTAMAMAGILVTVFALVQIRPEPWYHPQYAIPLLGMMLGNAMNGVSLGLNNLTNGAARERIAIETRLALGQTREEALRPVVREALRTAMLPIINSMAASGIVFLPGMMTGQILAGVDPEEAVKYQLLIMFMVAGGTALGAFGAVIGGARRLSDARHRLRLDRIERLRED